MARHWIFTLCLALIPAAAMGGGADQQTAPKRPPALIRDTGVAEGKEAAETVVKKEYNPALAEKNLKIGDIYLKKGNYEAAISRYRDAIDFQPSLVDAYEALGRTYEKKGDTTMAVAVYREYLAKYPDAPKASEFKSRIERFEKKK